MTDARWLTPRTFVFGVLVALTLVTFAAPGTGLSDRAVMFAVIGIALIKSQLVVDFFMGIRGVRGFWRPLLTGYLWVVGGLIAYAFLAARSGT